MKKTVPIALILLLLFNVLGYQALFFGLRLKSDIQFADRVLNERYEAQQTVTLRIPVALPYSYDQENYQQAEGRFQYAGKYYQLVAQRMYQDTLYVVCLYDEGTTKIEKDYSDYVKTFADQSDSHHQKARTITPSFIKEYLASSCTLKPVDPGWSTSIVYNSEGEFLVPSYSVSIIHPPERA